MKKKMEKGFTLIELIVVIAIIAVLAAVLIPSMLGFVTDAKISSANTGAKLVHTSAASWVTNENIEGNTVTVGTYTSDPTAGNRFVGVNSSTNADLSDGLGEDFDGYFIFEVNTAGTGVDYAAYCKSSDVAAAVTAGGTAPQAGGAWYTKAEQKTAAKATQHVVGVYPLHS